MIDKKKIQWPVGVIAVGYGIAFLDGFMSAFSIHGLGLGEGFYTLLGLVLLVAIVRLGYLTFFTD